MTLAGERIQALFSELTLEDQTTVPRFENVWRKAELCASRPGQRSIRSLALAVAAVIAIAGLSVIFWPVPQQNIPVQSFVNASVFKSIPVIAVVRNSTDGPRKTIKVSRGTNKNNARKREVLNREALMLRDVAIISSWRSPTETLLESPASSVLRSGPKLNDSVKELESFLSCLL
jgi:hypothetical protein